MQRYSAIAAVVVIFAFMVAYFFIINPHDYSRVETDYFKRVAATK
jgi:hypothetical protein